MARTREAVCEFYEYRGKCSKNRDANHFKYCQRCDKYRPRAKVKKRNKKKDKLKRTRDKEWKNFEY